MGLSVNLPDPGRFARGVLSGADGVSVGLISLRMVSVDSGSGRKSWFGRSLLIFLDQVRDADGPGGDLGHAHLAQLIEERPVADLQPFVRLLAIPVIVLPDVQNSLPFLV